MTDLNTLQKIIDEIGTPYRAGQVFNAELEAQGISYRIDKSGMSRIYKGEAKPNMVALALLVLSNAGHS